MCVCVCMRGNYRETSSVIMLEWVYNVSIQAVNLSCVAVFKCVYASLSMHYLLHYCCVATTASESHAPSVWVCGSSSLSETDLGLTGYTATSANSLEGFASFS